MAILRLGLLEHLVAGFEASVLPCYRLYYLPNQHLLFSLVTSPVLVAATYSSHFGPLSADLGYVLEAAANAQSR